MDSPVRIDLAYLRRLGYVSEEARRVLDRLAQAHDPASYAEICRAAGIDPERISLSTGVHDDVLIDVHEGTVEERERVMKALMESFGKDSP